MLPKRFDYLALIIPQKFDFWYRLISDANPNSHEEALGREKQTLI